MQSDTKIEHLDFPLIISIKGLPISDKKKLDAIWQVHSLPELCKKINNHVNLKTELLLPEELLINNKYAIPWEDVIRYQHEKNLALIRFRDELLVMTLEPFTHPSKVLLMFLENICEKVSLYTVNSDQDTIHSLTGMHKTPKVFQ